VKKMRRKKIMMIIIVKVLRIPADILDGLIPNVGMICKTILNYTTPLI
jgi:hypothetical protein